MSAPASLPHSWPEARFFAGDDAPPELSELLRAHLARTANWFGHLDASHGATHLILGGGYGRGEGGIGRGERDEPRLFNDLDYFLLVAGTPAPSLPAAVRAWEKEESDRLGIDVEATVLSHAQVRASAQTMMLQDLRAGHVLVAGNASSFLALVPELPMAQLPLVEATRLLWNRGSGLYFSAVRLAGEPGLGAAAFVQRNQRKAELALGDAWLCQRGLYHGHVRVRLKHFEEALAAGAPAPVWASVYRRAVRFKLRPGDFPLADWAQLQTEQAPLRQWWQEAFLALESQRLGQTFAQPHDYLGYRGRLYPEVAPLKALLLAVRDRLRRRAWLRPIFDYPRGALQRALLALLSEDRRSVALAGQFLPPPEAGAPDQPEAWEKVYRQWWSWYS